MSETTRSRPPRPAARPASAPVAPTPAALARAALAREVLAGLTATPKQLPPRLLYDAAGAALFERITALPEYYLTRAEVEILHARAPEIAALAGPGAAVIEYGSGAGRKTRLLLDALDRPAAYVPIDVSGEQLADVSARLGAAYPRLAVRPVQGDYTAPLVLPPLPPGAGRRLAFFPGSTIGNMDPPDAARFLRRVRAAVGPEGALVLGVDRRNDARVLRPAYDDAAGVTAAFNRNLLVRLNRELGADFDVARFRHRARWNAAEGRVEMHLESVGAQIVHVGGERVRFASGETLWTESSYKYDGEALLRLVRDGGFSVARRWTDAADRFWVVYLRATPACPTRRLPRVSGGGAGAYAEG
jgi:dimethylhistidine N-methyltransferase